MLTVHLSCPCCTHTLRCRRLIAPGERLRCPHCGDQFRAGIDEPTSKAEIGKQDEKPVLHSALGAWLVFAVLLLLAGGGIATAIAFSKRGGPEEATTHASSPSERDRVSTPSVSRGALTRPRSPSPAPSAPPRKSSPPPNPLPTPSADVPKPPPLPSPPRKESERTKPAKKKPAKLEKLPDPEATPTEAPQIHWLPPYIQKHVDRSIDNGVEYLRRQQHADGSWGNQTGKAGKSYTPGITALCGLTLLECGVPPRDPQVRLTAHYLRQRMPELTNTYSISMAILFFDRLGEAADAARIRTLALRLIAGQKTSGGWDYYCPILRDDEELGLLALLYKDRPTTSLDLFTGERLKVPPLEGEVKRDAAKLDTDLYRPRPSKVPPLELFVAQGSTPSSASREPRAESREPDAPPRVETLPPPEDQPEEPPMRQAAINPGLPGDSRRLSKRALEAAEKLPDALRRIPALRAADLLRNPPDLSSPRTDNSNTQLAILGLLTAENHDVPMERAMALLDWRFRNSLTDKGGWNYRPSWETTPSMTAAALMGLALKHGLLLPNRRDRGRNVTVRDELIQHGFATLNRLVEESLAGFVYNQKPLDKLDLYCLWTVERVAVLYNVRTLGTLEWYPAGVQLLLPLQQGNGSWGPGGTTCLKEPCVSTSFALLFLKRSNLARDLTERLNVPADK
ncbi:MAG TPA: hypothetical protein VMG10_11560 [Gemmataceae bacterium]|nr:hypothetical protein [Gemmataceae bacterium]